MSLVTQIDEISPEVFRLSTFLPQTGLQFNQFLVRDEQPLLFHTGYRQMFPLVREAVARLIDPKKLRWVGYSHFEQDECGSLSEWLELAPQAQPVCNLVGAVTCINDITGREIRPMSHGENFSTGRLRFRFLSTPHVPHGWDASLLFEETNRTLFCSDLFLQGGESKALANDVVDGAIQALIQGQAGPLPDAIPYTTRTDSILRGIAALRPKTLAVMHGPSYSGDGEKAVLDLAQALKETMSTPSS